MFAVIKKNEGLAKVIDAPSLKAAYDKLMYSEEDTLSAEDVAVLQEKRQENVSVPLASGKWHCFDIPFMFMAATRDDALMFADIFGKYTGQMRGKFSIGFER